MKKFLGWVIALPAGLALVAFALANRSFVVVSLDPLSPEIPWFSMNVPIWVILFTGIFLGLVIGWVAAWINQGKWRRAAHSTRMMLDDEVAKKQRLEKRLNQGEMVAGSPEQIA